MKPITFILGPQACGKTTKAKELTEHKKATWLNSHDLRWPLSIPSDTEVLVIDGVSSKKQLSKIKALLLNSTIPIHRPRKSTIEIERPEIIIISNILKAEDIRSMPDIEIIEMHKHENRTAGCKPIIIGEAIGIMCGHKDHECNDNGSVLIVNHPTLGSGEVPDTEENAKKYEGYICGGSVCCTICGRSAISDAPYL